MLPLASCAVTVLTPVKAAPLACASAMLTANLIVGPATKVTIAWVWLPLPLMTALPSRVATKTPLPLAVGAVTVALYVPLPWSVTAPTLPLPEDRLIVTVEPPLVR